MARRLQEQLDEWGHRLFVGRQAEVALFRSLLEDDDLSTQIIYVYGPSGVGKSTLLKELALLCRAGGIPCSSLNGRNIEATPAAFLAALTAALGETAGTPFDMLADQTKRHVLFVDAYEALIALDDWVIDSFIPELPDNVLLLLAGHDPPATRWRVHSALQALARSIPLGNLDPDESRSYLGLRDIAVEQHEPIVRFTHGHPLALALVADACAREPDTPFQPERVIDIVHTLLAPFVQDVPTPAHRAALDASSIVRVLTEPLLADLLAVEEAHDLFEWLRKRTFIESDSAGIFPSDLAREVLAIDLRWRNPDRFSAMRQRAHAHYLRHFALSHGNDHGQSLVDDDYLYRHSPAPASHITPLILSYPDFANAVHHGLRHLLEPEALVGNALLRSRIVLERIARDGDSAARVSVLQSMLRQTAEELRASPRSARCYRALYHTYIAPAPTQERAAEMLDLPYSTFRRHLKEGIDRMTALLWQREIGELPAQTTSQG